MSMKAWKVLIQYEDKLIEFVIEAFYYSTAKYTAEEQYPGCKVCSITEQRVY